MKELRTYNFYDNYYYVDKEGNIYNKKHMKLSTFISKHRDNYRTIILRGYDSKRKLHRCGVSVHRMVAELWVDKPKTDEVLEVHHIDGDRSNSAALNLQWVTHYDNVKESFVANTHYQPDWKSENNPKAKLNKNEVVKIRKMYSDGKTAKEIHKDYNFVSIETIENIIKFRTWKHI